MDFVVKHQHASNPTSIVPVEHEATSLPLDPEKNHLQDYQVEHTVQSHDHHVLPDTEKNVVRKMDIRIVPLVTALYVLAFLDRSNIGKYVGP